MRPLALTVLIAASCLSTGHERADIARPELTEPVCTGSVRPAAISLDWDPEFNSPDVAKVRAIGGYYRAMAAATLDQHRSGAGPTFRLACDEDLHARVLFGVPQAAGAALSFRLIALLDYKQVPLELNGTWSSAHALTLEGGEERTFEVALRPMSEGVHRLALVFLEDDEKHGLFGAYDLMADVYVGDSSRGLPSSIPQHVPARQDPSVQGSGYGIRLSTRSDVIQLAGNVTWSPRLELFLTFWGSALEGPRTVAVVALQDFEELDVGLPHPFVEALPNMVSVLKFRPREPNSPVESIRILLLTAPDHEIAPDGAFATDRRIKVYASQKAWIRLP